MNLHKVYATVIAAVVVVAAIIGWQWAEHVKEDAKTQAMIEQTEKNNKALADQNATLQSSIEQIKSSTAAKVDALEKQRITVTTPEQAIRIVHDQTPLPQATVQALPDAPTVLSQKDSIALAQFSLQCKECDTQLDGLKREAAARDAQYANLETVNTGLKQERDAALKQARGGSILKRSWRVVRDAAIGAAIGYALAKR